MIQYRGVTKPGGGKPQRRERKADGSGAPIPGRPQEPGQGQAPLHFKEDDVRVKRSRCRSVILSAAQDLCPASDPALRSG